ncbi:hypothetical protein O0L34_g510 [Tuta absoluta]|nr:hypothetical protein O0L34_g510 [Tuta absoluta]
MHQKLVMCVKPTRYFGLMKLDFSDVPIYDRNKRNTGKNVKDVYSVRCGVMTNDTFKTLSYDYSTIPKPHNYYLSTEELLFEEAPNNYNSWFEHPRDKFCIDYKLDANASNVLAPSFWSISLSKDESSSDTIMNVVGLFLSCFFLALTFVVKMLVPVSWGLSDMVKMSYVATTFVAYFLLAINMGLQEFPVDVCLGMTYAIYFFLMASFSWMVVMSFDVWQLLTTDNIGNSNLKRSVRRKALRRYMWYSIGAWGLPAALTVFLIVVNTIDLRHIPSFITPNVPDFGCFIQGGEKQLYMYIPMLILILINWVFFILTSYNLWLHYKSTSSLDKKDGNKNISKQDHRRFKNKFFAYLKLSILSGLSWILEMASSYSPTVSFWLITDCYNMLTGFFVFLILVCNKKTYKQLKNKFTKQASVTSRTTTTTSTVS